MRKKKNKQLIKLILTKSKEICKSISKSQNTKRGRPKVYEDYIIISALLIKTLENLSLRDLEERLKELFPKVPDFTTLHYRLKKLSKSHLEELIEKTAQEILKVLQAKELHCLIADGTGFGYADSYFLRSKRGKELREVKAHIKTEVLVGVVRGKSFVVGVKAEEAYSDENRLLKEMLKKMFLRAKYFMGDAYYGKSVEVLKRIRELGMKAIVPVRDSMRMKVKNSYRRWAKRNYEEHKEVYKRYRYRVEQVIGVVKNLFGDRERVYEFHLGCLYVLGRFASYNLMVLVELLFCLFAMVCL